jgi:hypothetical protein
MGLALVAILAVAIALPASRNGPAASPAYPADRALTTAELASLMAGPAPAVNAALAVSTTIDVRNDVCPMNRYPTVGTIHGIEPRVCVMGATLAAQLPGPTATGVFAFRYLGPGYLGLLGEITPAPGSKVAFSVADDWPLFGRTFLVEGWLGAIAISCPTYIATTGGDPLDPDGADQCEFNWLTDDPELGASVVPGGPPAVPGGGRNVEAGGMRLIDDIPGQTPVHGVFVVRSVTEQCAGASPQSNVGCTAWRVLARIADLPMPLPRPASPSPSPTPTERTAPPATPVAPTPGPLDSAPVGLLGSGDRPLTEGEFATLWAADPAHLADRIVIVKGPVPTGFECWAAGAADAVTPAPACHIGVLDGFIAQEGYWAVRVGSDGSLTIIGEISIPTSGFVFPLEEALTKMDPDATNQFFIVDAWLDWEPSLACDTPPYPTDSLCGAGAVWSVLTSAPLAQQPWGYPFESPLPSGVSWFDAGLGAYQVFGSSDLNARPIHGLYLLKGTVIQGRLELAALP